MRDEPAQLFGSAMVLVADQTDDAMAARVLAEDAAWSPTALLGAYGVAERLVQELPLDPGAHRAAGLLRRALRETVRAPRPATRL